MTELSGSRTRHQIAACPVVTQPKLTTKYFYSGLSFPNNKIQAGKRNLSGGGHTFETHSDARCKLLSISAGWRQITRYKMFFNVCFEIRAATVSCSAWFREMYYWKGHLGNKNQTEVECLLKDLNIMNNPLQHMTWMSIIQHGTFRALLKRVEVWGRGG